MRLTYTLPHGWHGLYMPDPAAPFDTAGYTLNLIARFFQTNGTELVDDPCLEDSSCSFIPQTPPE